MMKLKQFAISLGLFIAMPYAYGCPLDTNKPLTQFQVRSAIQCSPLYKAIKERGYQADASASEALAVALPRIDISLADITDLSNNSNQRVPGFNFNSNEGQSKAVTITQPLVTFGAASNAYAAAKFSQSAQKGQNFKNVIELQAAALKAYNSLALFQILVEIKKAQLNSAKEIYKQTDSKLRAGLGIQLDLSQSEALVLKASSELFQANADLQSARQSLAALLGLDEKLADSLQVKPHLSVDPEQVYQYSADSHPDYFIFNEQLNSAKSNAKALRASMLPTISAQLNYQDNNAGLFASEQKQARVLFNWTIDSGGLKARADRAQSQARELALQSEHALRVINADFNNLILDYKAKITRYELALKQLEISQQALASSLVRFREGLTTLTETVLAFDQVSIAQTNKEFNLFELKNVEADLFIFRKTTNKILKSYQK